MSFLCHSRQILMSRFLFNRSNLRYSVWHFCLLLIAFTCRSFAADQEIDFDRQIAPLLSSHCLECHSGPTSESELDLSERSAAFKGGESGIAIVPKELNQSLIWERIEADEMPPKHPLDDEDKLLIKRWIEQGAKWGTNPIDRYAYSTKTRAGRDWWSLQPLKNVTPPSIGDSVKNPDSNRSLIQWSSNEIDLFIAKKLAEKKLSPSPAATPRVLIRRLYFDLIGLPPTPEQIEQFEKNPSEKAYQKIVDKLLASKHYGERWGRHWLDVVRFGESDGFERNAPRKNAWHYRDWVIKALNQDMPYDQFVKMQLIGDQLVAGVDGASATGFWTAGVHNTVVGGSKRMKQLARQDEIEEVLATVGQTFVGLTVNCARCHDHKFDPISQKEFYQMASAISGLGYGERTETTAVDQKRVNTIDAKLLRLRRQLSSIEQTARKEILAERDKGNREAPALPKAYARWEFETDLNDSIGELHGTAINGARIENGALIVDGKSIVQTTPLKKEIKEKTLEVFVQLDSLDEGGGGAITIETLNGVVFDSIVFAEREPKQWMAGSNGFARTDSFQAPAELDATKRPVHFSIVYQADGTIIGYRDGKLYGSAIRKSGLQTYNAEQSEIIFGLRHKPVGGAGRHLKAKIFHAAFYDRALSAEEVAATAGDSSNYVSEKELVEFLSSGTRLLREKLKAEIGELAQQKSNLLAKANQRIYTLTPGGGAVTNVLLRGDPDNVGEVVSPGAVASVSGVDADFSLASNSNEKDRRKKLADWIASKNNPLFSRVIANRIWHYHFGVGIVDTPNDLGFNGGRPTHPELLEWLSVKFRDGGFRMKSLHRLIVSSSTYRQAGYVDTAKHSPNPNEIDADNRLLWKMNPRRLEAESIRDAMLTVSGKLNDSMSGGPSFEDVSIKENSGTTYYEPIDVNDDRFFRRTVYRFNPRGGRSALLDTFDCPDSASTAPRRAVTTTPLQALSLLNNSFVLHMSDYFAARIENEAGDNIEKQVDLAWRMAVQRKPDANELLLASKFLKENDLKALCRALFNISEFVVIE